MYYSIAVKWLATGSIGYPIYIGVPFVSNVIENGPCYDKT